MTGQLQIGLTAGVPEALYHRGIVDGEESLSHSGMKTLLGSTPAHFRREVDHPEDRVQKKEFDLGSAAHAYVLGAAHSSGLAEIRQGPPTKDQPFGTGAPHENYRTKDAQTKRDAAYSLDLVPILLKDVSRVEAMVKALRSRRCAAELLAPDTGVPELTAIVRDPESGVLLRARFDWWRHDARAVDYKTTSKSAAPSRFARTGYDLGYYLQAATYSYIAELLEAPLDGFDFVVQEPYPPYEPSVLHFGPASLELGRLRMRRAIAMFAECKASGVWPGYPDESVEVDVPFWALREAGIQTTSTSSELSGDSTTDVAGLLDDLERILSE